MRSRRFYVRALETAEKTFEAGHALIAMRQGNLALVLKDLGESEKARELMEKALAAAEKTFAPGHRTIMTMRGNLKGVLRELERKAKGVMNTGG